MPAAGTPGSYLRGGEFYSPVEGRLRTDDVVLSELRQPGSRSVPRHEHELAYITVVLQGDYLDLRPLVRDALLLELPVAPLCRDDCRGLCPRCGADLNSGPCDCRPSAGVEALP